MTLTECIQLINLNHPQKEIPLSYYDYRSGKFVQGTGPQFLYRGENNHYPQTQSALQRLALSDEEKKDIVWAVVDMSEYFVKMFYGQNLEFLPALPEPSLRQGLINEISGLVQHYGFPISLLDFSSDINIAGFFGYYENQSGKGKICVIKTKELYEKQNVLIDLRGHRADRPNKQSAFALMTPRDFDLKSTNSNLNGNTNAIWYEFDLASSDSQFEKLRFCLDTKNDSFALEIKKYVSQMRNSNPIIMTLFRKIASVL